MLRVAAQPKGLHMQAAAGHTPPKGVCGRRTLTSATKIHVHEMINVVCLVIVALDIAPSATTA